MEEQQEARTAADALLEQCDQDGCTNTAIVNYTWDWGMSGKCCAGHQAEFTQKQEALSRKVQFAPLQTAAPAPLTRDQRTRLQAEVLVLKEELEDAKLRGLDLYRENVKLAQSVQALTVRGRESEAQLRDMSREIERLQTELGKRDAEHGALNDEVERLRTITKFLDDSTAPPATTPSQRGLQTPPAPPESESRVDG